MRLFSGATLDKLETRFVHIAPRWRKKPPPKWLMPTARLEPTQPYPLRDYVQSSVLLALAIGVLILVTMLFTWLALWYQHPAFFRAAVSHHGRAHSILIGLLSHDFSSTLPLDLVFLSVFNLLIYLPTWYFWNRRAERLRLQPAQPRPEQSNPLPLDPTLWPPAPTTPPS